MMFRPYIIDRRTMKSGYHTTIILMKDARDSEIETDKEGYLIVMVGH